jgi:NitT/TauT family transport system ATP-binding protein
MNVHAVEMQNVGVGFRRRRRGAQTEVIACQGVDLTVEESSFVAIVGPSGCGKSTLLRVVAGLLEPTTGSARLYGREIHGPDDDCAMVFQQHNLFPWKSAIANVEFGLKMQGVGSKERRATAERYLELVGLQDFVAAYPHELSGGMQQRIGLARALAVDPKVLLLDEPFGALDAQTRVVLQDELMHLWQGAAKTALFVTHDIEEALYLADRVIVMSSRPGRVIADITVPFGRPRDEEIRSDPRFGELKQEIWHMLKPSHDVRSGDRAGA